MPKDHNKLTICPNCDTHLNEHDNFCPNCGQENHEVKLPLGHIAYEFVESITHFDNKLWNSLKAIFTQPGKMTAEFLQGKRMRYVPPARLYVFVSVIFFFLIGKFADHQVEEMMKESSESTLIGKSGNVNFDLNGLVSNDSLLRTRRLRSLAKKIDVKTSLSKEGLAKTARQLKKLKPAELDSLLTESEVDLIDSNRVKLRELIALIPDKPNPELDTGASLNIGGKKFKSDEERIAYEKKVSTMSDAQIDSIIRAEKEEPNWLTRNLYRRQGKISNLVKGENTHEFLHTITKNLSVVMFVLMPFVAVLLLFFYFRRGRFYYEHLIFSVHIHTVIFLLFSLALLSTYATSPETTSSVFNITFWICWIYFLLSIKRVYHQSWGKTIVKFLLLSLMYSITAALFFVGALLIGFFTF